MRNIQEGTHGVVVQVVGLDGLHTNLNGNRALLGATPPPAAVPSGGRTFACFLFVCVFVCVFVCLFLWPTFRLPRSLDDPARLRLRARQADRAAAHARRQRLLVRRFVSVRRWVGRCGRAGAVRPVRGRFDLI